MIHVLLMAEIVVAIDAGTSGVRSIFFDTEGKVLSMTYREYNSSYPHPSWVEQDAGLWWETACQTLTTSISSDNISPDRIAAISITNQRETVVPVDKDGLPLRPAIIWQDRRTTEQCEWIRKKISLKKIYQTTGLTIDPYFTAPKIMWIQQNEPDTFKNTDKFLLVHDFILHRLTGEYTTDFSNASRTMLFDIEKAEWSEEILSAMGIPKEKLPKPVESGTLVGEVTERAAKETGLNTGTPVVAGGGDQQCAALGVGVVREGAIKATTGTGTFILAYSSKRKFEPNARLLCSRHVVPDAFVVEASMFTTGSALRWFRDHIATEERHVAGDRGIDPYEVITEAAESIPAGSEGVIHLPHFVGAGAPHWNPHARGLFGGLSLGHTRRHMMRSVLEGVSYDIRSNLDIMKKLGLPAGELRVTGGAARSDVWMQIQADVLGIPMIRTQLEEATALGAAILACKGVGIFKSMTEAADEMVSQKDVLLPSPENRSVYDTGYKKYGEFYRAVSGIKWDTS
ncbi:MAG: xylulokinase [Candidatus Thorarchaeota archaeon]|nr:xylulokinase [Candidatus Thorarchaeota archaeon]